MKHTLPLAFAAACLLLSACDQSIDAAICVESKRAMTLNVQAAACKSCEQSDSQFERMREMDELRAGIRLLKKKLAEAVDGEDRLWAACLHMANERLAQLKTSVLAKMEPLGCGLVGYNVLTGFDGTDKHPGFVGHRR